MISFQQILSFSQKEIYKNCWILKNVNSTNFANISGNFWKEKKKPFLGRSTLGF